MKLDLLKSSRRYLRWNGLKLLLMGQLKVARIMFLEVTFLEEMMVITLTVSLLT